MAKKKTAKDKWGKTMIFGICASPYNQEVIVVVNGTVKDAVTFLKKQSTANAKIMIEALEDKEHEQDHEAMQKSLKKGGGFLFHALPVGYLMMFNHQESWVETVGLVVHESLHFVHYVLHRAGIQLVPESDEAFTYLLEDVVEQIIRKIY